jgi:hypothetical protein
MKTDFCFNCDTTSVFDYNYELDAIVCDVCECEGY